MVTGTTVQDVSKKTNGRPAVFTVTEVCGEPPGRPAEARLTAG